MSLMDIKFLNKILPTLNNVKQEDLYTITL